MLGKNIRTNPDGSQRDHQGWDILSMPGSPVFAVTNGTISKIKDDGNSGYGRQVYLSFNFKGKEYFALYAHLQSIEVVQGMFVAEGEKLGTSGQTGNAQGQPLSEAHLHFEIRTSLNPGSGVNGRVSPSLILGTEPIRVIVKDAFAGMPTF
ncbi:MAG TPA: M23 family metallopeptidase [Pyrinomonadaceae bacterium]|nr:M23 family metallopeptidase [Pyrinomonadaceae bacterium]